MKMFRVLAILGLAGLASCTGDSPAGGSPPISATPSADPSAVESDTPNSLPGSLSNREFMNSSGGVVGVTHLPP